MIRDGESETAYFTFSYEPLRDAAGRVRRILVLARETTEEVQARQRVDDLVKALQEANERLHAQAEELASSNEELHAQAEELQDAWNRTRQTQDRIRRLNSELEQRVVERTEQLRQRATELEAANQELEAFSYSVSHDLRTPLRSIDGFSKLILEDYAGALDDTGQDYLNRVRAAAQRMGRLIDDILQLSRAARVEMRRGPVDLSALAEGVVAELRQAAPERQAEVAIAPGMVAEGDASLLRVVLQNFLGNAWKFSRDRTPACIGFDSTAQDGERVYRIRDNGAGFDMAHEDKLFGAFQRLHTDAEFPGTGIGLALAQRIIRRHGGRVWVHGEVGRGATFYFTLGEQDENRSSATGGG